MAKLLKYGQEGREKILSGMCQLSDAVTVTLGPKGRLVLLDRGNSHPVYTKDGVSVAKDVELKDRIEQLGAITIQEVARRVNAVAGDGTTTATFMTTELCKIGNKLVNLDFDAIDIKKGFEKARDEILEELNKQKKYIKSEKDILHIATISANNDEEIGNYIKEAFVNIGEGGLVSATDSVNRKAKTSIVYTNGLEFPHGYFTSLVVNTNNNTCELVNPNIILIGKDIDNYADFEGIFKFFNNENFVVIATGFSPEFQGEFSTALDDGILKNCVCVKGDGVSKNASIENMKDLAAVLGGVVVGCERGPKLQSFNPNTMAGHADRVVVSIGKTTITHGHGKKEEVEARIAEINRQIVEGIESEENAKSQAEIEYMKERIAKLSGGVATIYVGGFTDAEIKEKLDRYEDAINAVKSAIENGIIAGGGCGLLHIVKAVSDKHIPLENIHQEKGYQEFLKVMEKPARKIIESTGKDAGYWIEKIKESDNLNYGYNAKKEEFSENMYSDGIVDPAKIIEAVLSYGTSAAGTFISTDCVMVPDTPNISLIPNDKAMEREGIGGF